MHNHCLFVRVRGLQALLDTIRAAIARALECLGAALVPVLDGYVAPLHELGCRIIVEGGGEGRDIAELLNGLGIDYAQGWLFGRPAPAAELLRW